MIACCVVTLGDLLGDVDPVGQPELAFPASISASGSEVELGAITLRSIPARL